MRYGLTITGRSEAALASVADDLRAAGAPEVSYRPVDMADRDCLPQLVQLHERRYDAMSALILSAGVGSAGPFDQLATHRYDKTIAVNLTAAYDLIRHCLPSLRRAADRGERAQIVALSSITGVYAEAGLAVYGATKAALLSLVDTLNAEESGSGVSATAIAPAYVDTDMSAWVADRIPPASMIPVDDVVQTVDMLLGLSPRTVIGRIVMSRAGSDGYRA
jgi:short-subunit dehydrogenase